jgi:hypothetical protein
MHDRMLVSYDEDSQLETFGDKSMRTAARKPQSKSFALFASYAAGSLTFAQASASVFDSVRAALRI